MIYSRFLTLIHIDDGLSEEEKEKRRKQNEAGALSIESASDEDIKALFKEK